MVDQDDKYLTSLFPNRCRHGRKLGELLVCSEHFGRVQRAARGRATPLAFIDDDCLATPTWLENLVAALRKNPRRWLGARPSKG